MQVRKSKAAQTSKAIETSRVDRYIKANTWIHIMTIIAVSKARISPV